MPYTPLKRVARAKINLGLHVLRRRADGYHDVETVLVPIGWADELRAVPAPALSLSCDHPALPTDDRNLVVRAGRALARHAGVDRGAALELHKRVPYGAGLGGGSSDAAATLRLLSELWEIELSAADLQELAGRLGADVPFFLNARPALATQRGDVLVPLAGATGPYALPFALVVAVPRVRVSTADAYSLVTPRAGRRPELAELVLSNDLERWRNDLVNDFQPPVTALHPEIAVVLAALASLGADFTSLSGSGSACFGVFENAGAAAVAGEALRDAGCEVWVERPTMGS